MGFIRDFVTAVESVTKSYLLSFSCSFSQLLFHGPSSKKLNNQHTSAMTPWHLSSSRATSAHLVQQWNGTALPTCPQSASPVLTGILLRTGTGGKNASTAPRYVWGHILNIDSYLFFLIGPKAAFLRGCVMVLLSRFKHCDRLWFPWQLQVLIEISPQCISSHLKN